MSVLAQIKNHYAVIGNPIAHSVSPQIHTLFARQTQRNIDYTRLLADVDNFNGALDSFIKSGAKGANVTVPFKLDAFARCDKLSRRAQFAGAVNTLSFGAEDKLILGDNTDGIGLVRDITHNYDVALGQKNILILGAGGAVRGILQPFFEEKPAHIFIANRTPEKAKALADEFSELGDISAGGFESIPQIPFDIIINGTAASLSGDTPPIDQAIVRNRFCYDMVYGKAPTAFLQWATEAGARQAVDGLGMLVEQAAESFLIWEGVRPDTQPVINALRN